MADEHVEGDAWNARDLLARLSDAVEETVGTVSRIEIRRASDYQFACRVWYVGQAEYEGTMLTVEE